MTILAIINELTPLDIPLENIYLDPNNPRFVDTKWVNILDDEVDKSEVQESARRRLVERFAVDKLRMNMEINGYLPIDRVIVREFAKNKYVILEGNRRICAAKMISNIAMDGSAVSEDVLNSLSIIPCLQYTGVATNASWIFQGLRHIAGVNDWSAFNKAKLLVEQMEEEDLSLTEVGKRFGLTPFGAGQWVRGYYAFKQGREQSDYITEVDERSYPYFQELFSRSSAPVREWMEWNDQEYQFENVINFNEFVGWLYPKELEEGETITGESIPGNWERRWLARRDDIRDVSFLIREAPDCFQEFRTTGELERLYSKALARRYEEQLREKADPVKEVFDMIKQCARALENIPLKMIRDDTLKAKLLEAVEELETKIAFVK